MTGGNMHGGSHLLHGRVLPEVPAKPTDGRIDLLHDPLVGDIGRGRLEAFEREEREIDDDPLEAEFAEGVAVVKIGIERAAELGDLPALDLRKDMLQKSHGRD